MATETTASPPASVRTAPSSRVTLFGIPFNAVTFDDAVENLLALAKQPNQSYAVTVNVDHAVRFHRQSEVRSLYTEADFVVADGMPIVWASRWLRKPLPERVAGSDLFPTLCQRAAGEELSVFLLGGAGNSAKRSAEILRTRHPTLTVAGTYCPPMGFEHDAAECERIANIIRNAGTDILFVGLGSPKQENWIVSHRQASGAKLSVGVGISFGFLCGDVVRAPRWMRVIGLEWFHRLVQEPGRLWRRHLLDDSVFVWMIVREFFRRS